ncbi:hypothetical protein AJ78_07045 [Emergomyces pasteurianus Ep9510]|uniref:RING-type E3 ubiquitin transferase n=1 Tax=Emergomyces pasteurianus Ep9510 TaxID=1447872 RepID=A0A1J9P8U3_9EURO|nr:hypothetical protein AJ78_07045 [Emergomyces pasteurianus Ep9510]
MRPPRLLLLLACFIFLPILLTTLSLLSAHPQHGSTSQSSVSGGASRFKAFFSFHAPASLFPPSAMISLTDDNSTFFLARPAAFGPALPANGLSGQLWIGSGFGDDALRKGGISTGAEGELGCSDVPGWEDTDKNQNNDAGLGKGSDKLTAGIKLKKSADEAVEALHKRRGEHSPLTGFGDKDDGTDDYLHHPLPESGPPGTPNTDKSKELTHADIQSLQESAEIRGKIVLLSRGGCGFLEKVKWVQRRGGIALVVGDDTRGGGLVTMYARGDTSNVTIPAIFTSHTTAHLLSSLIPPDTKSDPKSLKDPSRATSGDKPAKNSNDGKVATATQVGSNPTSTPNSESSPPKAGFLQSLFSSIGLGRDNPYPWHLQEDSRRPPSSGNIDWVTLDEFDDEETSQKSRKSAQQNKEKDSGDGLSESRQSSSDDFIIGVQDWRDPDLLAAGKTSNVPQPTPNPKSTGSKQKDGRAGGRDGDSNTGASGNRLKGGSITPGSGEYALQYKSTNDKGSGGGSNSRSAASDSPHGNSKQDSHWWPSPFGWGSGSDDRKLSSLSNDKNGNKDVKGPSTPVKKSSKENGKHPEHEGLWVTLTPTSMSTSPFFDTLLVLVVSPLITLTVVYALLLLRSRIRRRRWRAPKAVVDRLPVRTYHTIPSVSQSSGSPQTATSPEASSPSSPLLSNSRARSPRPRPRSQTTSGIVAASSHDLTNDSSSSNAEKPNSSASLWRRRYTGRQVECVVCLEEYIDGQSRVMSLPCGHEFHAECITPWLTTRRRTCPICKGDVVRSMGRRSSSSHVPEGPERMSEGIQAVIAETRNDSPSAAVPVPNAPDDIDSDLEQGDNSTTSLLNRAGNPNSQSSWSNLASLSLSALSGDSVWHRSRTPRSDRNR